MEESCKVRRYYELLAHTKTGKYEPELKIRDYHNGAPLNEIQLGWNNYITWPQDYQLKFLKQIDRELPDLEIKFTKLKEEYENNKHIGEEIKKIKSVEQERIHGGRRVIPPILIAAQQVNEQILKSTGVDRSNWNGLIYFINKIRTKAKNEVIDASDYISVNNKIMEIFNEYLNQKGKFIIANEIENLTKNLKCKMKNKLKKSNDKKYSDKKYSDKKADSKKASKYGNEK